MNFVTDFSSPYSLSPRTSPQQELVHSGSGTMTPLGATLALRHAVGLGWSSKASTSVFLRGLLGCVNPSCLWGIQGMLQCTVQTHREEPPTVRRLLFKQLQPVLSALASRLTSHNQTTETCPAEKRRSCKSGGNRGTAQHVLPSGGRRCGRAAASIW